MLKLDMCFTSKLLALIVSVYFFLFIGSFLDLLDSWKRERSNKNDH